MIPLDRLEHLVNLANDKAAADNERRNAAIEACRMITDNKLIGTIRKVATLFAQNERAFQAILDGRIQLFKRSG